MASLVWLIVWLVKGTPNLEWFGSWNDWAVALLGCIVFDVFSGREAGFPEGSQARCLELILAAATALHCACAPDGLERRDVPPGAADPRFEPARRR
jgi:hypothetical protein